MLALEVRMDACAVAIAEARAALGMLADRASSLDATSAYEHVLLTLDSYTGDAAPSATEELALDDLRSAVPLIRGSLLSLQSRQLNDLQVELLLALLDEAVVCDLG
jgi:hypothetical protein